MRVGIVYHMPFWRAADGTLWEAEGSFGRYVDSLAAHFDEIVLCVPERPAPGPGGSPLRAPNVSLAPLPYFEGPRQFYPRLPAMVRAIGPAVARCDLLHCRVPTPAALFAFFAARRRGVPTVLLAVGDLRNEVDLAPYRGVARWLWRRYVDLEEWGLKRMIARSLTFTNGPALYQKHAGDGPQVVETNTTTISEDDIAARADTCERRPVRILCVSRIHPRKGLRSLPDVLARLRAGGRDVEMDVVGPSVGRIGEQERAAMEADAARLGVADRFRCVGPMAIDALLPSYRSYDLFVLPTLAGEGIPRVLLEAMAAGLPVVTTAVAGIPGLVTSGVNGLLAATPSAASVADALAQVLDDPALRRRIIRNGYETARAHTLERQAAALVERIALHLGGPVRVAASTP